MRKRTLTMLILAAVVAFAIPATAQQFFDFNGQTVVPTMVGGALSMNAVIFDAPPATTPIVLDFANFEYTLVISGLTLDVDGTTQNYSGGMIALYEDAATAADFANGATFVDGAALLSGVVTDLSRTMFTPTIGTVLGHVDWTGGTRLSDIAPEDQGGWPLVSGVNASMFQVEPGYDEKWDGKVEPEEPIVGNEYFGFGELKTNFR